MKTLALAVLAAVATLSGCASAPIAKTCSTAPSSYFTDSTGAAAIGIYHCYRSDGLMAYEARQLPPAPPAPAAQPPAVAAKPAPNIEMADPCSELDGAAYTACRAAKKIGRKTKELTPVAAPKKNAEKEAALAELAALKAETERKAAIAAKVKADQAAAEKLKAEANK